MTYQIIIHGGANQLVDEVEERNQICVDIVKRVEIELKKGIKALDACEMAVNALEDAPLLDAGRGSYLQTDGKIRMDAALMTSNLDLGCVLQISGVAHPISVARKLLETPLHNTLSGEGAIRFASEMGFSIHVDLRTEERQAIHQAVVEPLEGDLSYQNLLRIHAEGQALGTVGCVVRDDDGMIVAGTSTGGLEICFPGRVGDTGQPGNGTYADPHAGISCTGIGEKIMRIGLARIIALYVELGETLDVACDRGIQKLGAIGGAGGIIAISHTGEMTARFNTKAMSTASARSAD